MPQIENPDKETKDDSQKALPTRSVVPESLSDAEFAKLSFPKQPFMENVGQNGIPKYNQERSFDSTPTDLTKAFQKDSDLRAESEELKKETDVFKINDTSLVEVEGEGETEIFNDFILKESNVTVNLNTPAGLERAESFASISARSIGEIKSQTGFTPEHVRLNPGLGYLEYEREGVKNLASPRFVLEEKADKSLTDHLNSQIQSLTEEKAELEKKLGGFNTFDKYSEERGNLYREQNEFQKKHRLSKSATQDEIENLPLQVKEEYQRLNERSEKLSLVQFFLPDYLSLTREIDSSIASFKASKIFQGKLVDGMEVKALFNPEENKLDIFNAQNKIIAKESISNSSSVYVEKISESGEYTKTEIDRMDYSTVRTVTEVNGNGKETKVSNFSKEGDLESILYNELGFKEKYVKGELSQVEIWRGTSVFKNSNEIAKFVNAGAIFREAGLEGGFQDFTSYANFKDLKDSDRILEAGLTGLRLEQITKMKSDVESELDLVRTGSENRKYQNLSATDLEKLNGLLEFREKILVDGGQLARYEFTGSGKKNLGELLFNDPSSRGYFEVKDNWIDWDNHNIKALINSEIPDLSKKELKLLASRIVFNKREDISKESVNAALSEIGELRAEFGAEEILKGRNILLAAHEDILDREFVEASGDIHQFGKSALVEQIKAIQGDDVSFELVRGEREMISDVGQLKNNINSSDIDPEKRVEILVDIDQISANEALTYRKIGEVLSENEVDYPTINSIIEKTRPTPKEHNENLAEIKNKILDGIANIPPPFTFIFDGHGGPDAIYLSDGQLGADLTPDEVNSTIKISSEEFGAALKKRESNFGSHPDKSKDIFVFQNCFNSNFIKDISRQGNQPNSIFIGSSEFNQLSLFSYTHPQGSYFLSDVVGDMGAEVDKSNTKINGVIERQFKHFEIEPVKGEPSDSGKPEILNTNPGIYVPNKSGSLIQISGLFNNLEGGPKIA